MNLITVKIYDDEIGHTNISGVFSTWDFWIEMQKNENSELFLPENGVERSCVGVDKIVFIAFVDNISTVAINIVENRILIAVSCHRLNVDRPLCIEIGHAKQKKILTCSYSRQILSPTFPSTNPPFAVKCYRGPLGQNDIDVYWSFSYCKSQGQPSSGYLKSGARHVWPSES